jgi:signal transduction histidine kinase
MRTNEELRAAQARLVVAERLAAVGELSAAVAHGIRNPVAGIKAAAQVASLDVADDHPLRESLNDIVVEADKLEGRIQALLDFSRPFEPNLAACRVDSIATDAVASLGRQAASRGVDLVVEIDPALPPLVADAAQIEQVLLALLSNAIDAMPAGGQVRVSAVSAGAGRVRLEVSDTGPGIPHDQLAKVFDLFVTTKPAGTGLGLAVAKKVVELHRGTIAVTSEPGRGTRFTIELPVASAP